MKELKVKVYTDGACSGNPGPGGWAALLLIKSKESKNKVVIKGGEKHTTNNRMELNAVIEALEFIRKNFNDFRTKCIVISDSAYVVNTVNRGSIFNWERNGWITTKNTDVVNRDLWEKLLVLMKDLKPKFIQVKGHNGDKFNEYIDGIANTESQNYKRLLESL